MSNLSPTLSDVLEGAFDELGQLVHGIATGGSSTTLVDSALKGKDDSWNKGTAFITYDSAGLGAAPENEFARITDYARATGTVTTSFSATTASGDHYALASRRWSADDMVGIVNRAMQRLGYIPKVDTSLTTSAGQLEYTLPAGFKRGPRRVYRHQFSTTDGEAPVRMTDWYQENGILIFRRQPASGVTLRLVGAGPADRLTIHSDALDESIALERAIAETAYQALRWLIRRTEGEDRGLFQDANDAAAYRDEVRADYPIRLPTPEKKQAMHISNRRRSRRNTYGPYLTS